MKKIYKLRFCHYANTDYDLPVIHNIIYVCASSERDAIASIRKAHSDENDLISIEVLEVIDFVDID